MKGGQHMKRIALYLIVLLLSQGHAFAQFTLADTLKLAPNLTVFSRLVEACGLQKELSQVRDEVYEQKYLQGQIRELPRHASFNNETPIPQHRYYGYTIFAETDDFWQQALNKSPENITVSDVEQWANAQGTTLLQFVTYHILPVKLSPNNLVIHYNEKGYSYRTSTQYTIPTYELYETLGEGRRLLKLYQCGPNFSLDGTSDVFLNRTPELDNGMQGTLAELSVTPHTEGIRIDTTLSMVSINGYIYPISKPLLYTDEVRQQVLGGRLRYDFAGIFPELMNNNIRANKNRDTSCAIPYTVDYPYCEGLTTSELTQFYYLSGLGQNWMNWQGDECNIKGYYDFTIKLPPVPNDGEYELRLATQSNSYSRSITRFFFGKDKENLVSAGLAIDMREGGTFIRTNAGNFLSRIKWEEDVEYDDVYNRSIDLRLYDAGVMKGAANYSAAPGGTNYLRNKSYCLRRIIWRGELKAGETYYLRILNAMNDDNKECYLDYMEWCPKSVYANPEKPEDIW